MRNFTPDAKNIFLVFVVSLFLTHHVFAQTLSFPGADGFGRFAKGARGVANREVYIVTNLNDAGPGSFRDAVSTQGRIVVFNVSGIINLASDVVVSPNVTIAGQTAPGEGIVLFGKRVTFTGASNSIARYLRIRLGATGNSGKDASGLANGSNMIFDHMSFTWGMDEVFSINWDSKGTAPDSITVQNSIIGQGLHRENHSAGGLIQTPDGGKVSLLRNLYISNKTRNPKVKGINEFVNNVVYDWGNGNRLGDQLNYGWSGEGYIMGGSSGVSEVNIINNYFVSGPLTPPDEASPFSRGTGTFFLYGAGNYFDNNQNGVLDGSIVPYNSSPNGYPGIADDGFKTQPFPYPAANPSMSAAQAYQYVIDNVGVSYPRRDQVDNLLINEVISKGIQGFYVYRETDLPFSNGGVGDVFSAPAPLDSDSDGMPDAWEDANGLNKNNPADAVLFSNINPEYLNIEVYVNSLINTTPSSFIKPPSSIVLTASSFETPVPNSKIVVQWKDNSDNETYFVLERSEDGVNYTDVAHPLANSTSYDDVTGLIPNKTYYYRLKAIGASASSVYSLPVSVKTPPLPSAPSEASGPYPSNGFQYAELASGKLTLKWTGSSNTTSFDVYFGTAPDALTKKATVPYSANPSYDVTGLSDFVTYYWRINSINDKGITQGPLWTFRTTKAFPAAMVGYWSFDETEGVDIIDSSQFSNDGVLGLNDDDQSIRVAGKVKGALDFSTADPSKYVVGIPHQDQLFLDKSSFSLSFWMKAPASLLPTGSTSAYLLCKGSITKNTVTGATGKRFDIEFKSGQIRFAIDDDVNKDELAISGTPFFTNDWVHVVAMRDTTSKKLRLYLNGVLAGESATTKALGIGETSALIIGNIGELEFLSNANLPAPYKGMLDELKIFNYALTPDQVLEVFHTSPLPIQPFSPSIVDGAFLEGYENIVNANWRGGLKTNSYKVYLGTDQNNLNLLADVPLNNPSISFNNLIPGTIYYWRVDAIGPAGMTPGAVWSFKAVSQKGLVAHYKLDETAGTFAADNSSFHQNGTVIGMPEATWTTAKFGNGLQFKNPTSTGAIKVNHADHLLFDRNSFTISLWIKLTNGSSNYNSASPAKDCYLIQKGQFADPGGKWYGIQLKDSALIFAIDDAAAKVDITQSLKKSTSFNIFNNNWTNIIAIKDTSAKQIRLYINGVLAVTKSFSSTYGNTGKTLPLLIGNSLENKAFHDIMDDVRLYNYALTPAEITLAQKGTPPNVVTKNITAYLNNTGNITISPADVDNGSNDDYGIASMSLDKTSFDCSAVGNNTVVLTVTDIHGNSSTGNVVISVRDTISPIVITKNISVSLVNGAASITAADINNGSSDACSIKSISVNKNSFNCANIGANEVTLTVTDVHDNSSTAKAIVTVIGAIPRPSITVSRNDNTFTGGDANTIYLGYGAQQLNFAAIDSGSSLSHFEWSPATALSNANSANTVFSPANTGVYTYSMTSTNEYGCTATIGITATVIDVRCGNQMNKVLVCHKGKEICISYADVQNHLAHGDRLAGCNITAASRTMIVRETANANELLVYPNPSASQTTISFSISKAGKYKLELFDINGALISVLQQGASVEKQPIIRRFNAKQYSSGMYFVKLTEDDNVIIKRIVIQ
jgi:hypothetical protein